MTQECPYQGPGSHLLEMQISGEAPVSPVGREEPNWVGGGHLVPSCKTTCCQEDVNTLFSSPLANTMVTPVTLWIECELTGTNGAMGPVPHGLALFYPNDRLVMPCAYEGVGFPAVFAISQWLPIMHITFWFANYSIMPLFLFPFTFAEVSWVGGRLCV